MLFEGSLNPFNKTRPNYFSMTDDYEKLLKRGMLDFRRSLA